MTTCLLRRIRPPRHSSTTHSTLCLCVSKLVSWLTPRRPGLRSHAVLKPFQSKKPPVQTPRVIILSLSGMRCADVVRAVKPFKGQGEVAKVRQHALTRVLSS